MACMDPKVERSQLGLTLWLGLLLLVTVVIIMIAHLSFTNYRL